MLLHRSIHLLFAFSLVFIPDISYSRQYHYDSGCDCFVPDQTSPEISIPDDQESNPFILKGTGVDSKTSKRAISKPVKLEYEQPDGVDEVRLIRYSTPKNFANRSSRSINLWLVFHGAGGNSNSMHEFFEEIPHTSPTLLVYPKALLVDYDNRVDTSGKSTTKWRAVRKPGSAADPDSFRDVVFIDWLVQNLLLHNTQLNPDNVYVSGFSSGAGMSWMLLCYRSAPFQGFAMYSQQLGSIRESGGCGNGQLAQVEDKRTGYEKLTGQQSDKYGYKLVGTQETTVQRASTRAVFYAHGTADDNLIYDGNPGCWERNECELTQDPQYSMDPGGLLEGRDDISTVSWLIGRHQLPSKPSEKIIILDGNTGAGEDNVTTHRYDYQRASDSGARVVSVQGKPVRWYEMVGGGHGLSALDRGGGDQLSKDYDVSVHTQRFFETEAGMLKKQ